eukprot:448938-Alexandrium_andersonii.AAC.1
MRERNAIIGLPIAVVVAVDSAILGMLVVAVAGHTQLASHPASQPVSQSGAQSLSRSVTQSL